MEEFITSFLYSQIKLSVFSNKYDSLYSGAFNTVLEEHSAIMPVPVAARSKACFCGHFFAGNVGLNPPGPWMFAPCECCVMSGRGLCVGLITRPEESCRV
jgi:hypothetical protein